MKHGGTLAPVFDPSEVTHIVTDAPKASLLRRIRLQDLADIPDHIPTVKWSWIANGLDRCSARLRRSARGGQKRKGKEGGAVDPEMIVGGEEEYDSQDVRMDYEYLHATYKERVDAGAAPWRVNPRYENEQFGQPIKKKTQQQELQDRERQAVGDVHVEENLGGGEFSRTSYVRSPEKKYSSLPSILSLVLFSCYRHVLRGDDDPSSEFTQRHGAPHEEVAPRPLDTISDRLTSYPPSSNLANKIPGEKHPPKAQTRDPSSSQSTSSGSRQASAEDPLAQFYEQARAERDAEVCATSPLQ